MHKHNKLLFLCVKYMEYIACFDAIFIAIVVIIIYSHTTYIRIIREKQNTLQ